MYSFALDIFFKILDIGIGFLSNDITLLIAICFTPLGILCGLIDIIRRYIINA